jgi:hypothetical protein
VQRAVLALALLILACGSPATSQAPGTDATPTSAATRPLTSTPVASEDASVAPDSGAPVPPPTPGASVVSSDAPSGDATERMPDANPINVSVTPDPEHSARAVIGSDGGTLETTDAAGVTYTLTVPKNALVSTQGVRLTPVSFESLPFGTPASAGVAIEPDGIQLEAVATLTVKGGGATQQAFTFHGPGHDLARWIVSGTETRSLPVLGFAGFGLAPDTTGPADWRPGDPATRAVHDLAPTFYGDARTLALIGVTPIAQAEIDDQKVIDSLCAAARERFERAVAMQPQALGDPLGVGTLVIYEILTVVRTSGASCGDELEPDFHAIAQILEAAARELSRRCETRSHDPILTFQRAVRLVRQAQILGIRGDDYEAIVRALSGLRTCTKYRLFIDSTIELSVTFHYYAEGGDEFDVEGTFVSGRQPMSFRIVDDKSIWYARMPIQIRSERWDDDCWTGGPFRLMGGLEGGPAMLEARAEPIVDYTRRVDVAGTVRVVDDDTNLLKVTLEIDGYALMPAKESDCRGLNPLLWDVGGSFMGAWGIDPFWINMAGDEARQEDEGQAWVTPPGTDTLLLEDHHARLNAVHHFTSDSAGSGFDFAYLFASPD